jgi:hypothetical protein
MISFLKGSVRARAPAVEEDAQIEAVDPAINVEVTGSRCCRVGDRPPVGEQRAKVSSVDSPVDVDVTKALTVVGDAVVVDIRRCACNELADITNSIMITVLAFIGDVIAVYIKRRT